MRSIVGLTIVLLFVSFTATAQNVVDEALYQVDVGVSVNQLDWSPDGQFITVASNAGFAIYSSTLVKLSSMYDDRIIHGAAWSPDGKQIALTHDRNVEIWNWDVVTDSLEMQTSLQHEGFTILVSWSADGTRLVTVENASASSFGSSTPILGRIVIWDTTTLTRTLTVSDLYFFDVYTYSTANVLDWSPSGDPLIIGVGNGGIREDDLEIFTTDLISYVIDAETGERIREIPLRGSYSLSVAWHPKGDLIAVGSF